MSKSIFQINIIPAAILSRLFQTTIKYKIYLYLIIIYVAVQLRIIFVGMRAPKQY